MIQNRWFNRLLSGTRGQIVQQLRQGPLTISGLEQALSISANAIRSHLSALERDGLIEQSTQRQGVGKPAHVYRLTTDANSLNPKAYDVVLGALLDALGDQGKRVSPDELLQNVAEKLAGKPLDRSIDFDQRIALVKQMLATLGADVEADFKPPVVELKGSSCPLSALVGAHPGLCNVLARAISHKLGVKVSEHCNRDAALPQCSFRARMPRAA